MRRLYVLMPDNKSCKKVVAELEASGVPGHHLHVLASVEQNLEGLPQATVWQKTELAHGIEWGIGLGGMAGLIGSLLTMAFPPPGLILGNSALLAGVVAGAGLGGLISAVLGSHQHNHTLDGFRFALSRGQLLLMIDAPRRQVEEIQLLIRHHHPKADIKIIVSDTKQASIRNLPVTRN